MNIHDIVVSFKNHQLQHGLGGDPEQEELYKWKLVTEQIGHPDVNAVDFAKEINSLSLMNLCYSTQTTAIRNFAKYEPEDYRKAFVGLFDESIDLQERVEKFISDCKELWDGKIKHNFTQKTSAMCDERLISFFLTLKDPTKYTFYKDEVYGCLCNLLGEKKKSAGHKLVHFYKLLNNHVIPVVENNTELINSINKEIEMEGYIHSTPLIAQTVLWNYARYIKNNENKQIWLFLAGKDADDYHFEEMYKDGIMALCGWDKVGDLSDYNDVDSIDEKRQSIEEYKYNVKHLTPMLHSIANEMKEGDIVLAKYSNADIVGMGIITGDYDFNEELTYGKHSRKIKWTHKGLWHCDSILSKFGKSQFPSKALTNVSQLNKFPYIPKILQLLEGNTQVAEQKNDSPMKYQKYIELLKENHNLVLTGAPGTGKTFMAQAIAEEMGCSKEEMCFVQFHPSYDYTDFVEGLRPIEKGDGQMGFERKDGVFKEFCKKAIRNKEDSKKTVEELIEENTFEERYKVLVDRISDDDLTEFELKSGKMMQIVEISDNNNIVLKTKGTDSNKEYIVSFDRLAKLAKVYSDYESITSISNISVAISDVIGGCHTSAYWAVMREIYKQECNHKEPTTTKVKLKDYVFIIDEINRGEASKIFGELFYAIDPGYRGKKDIRVKTQYQNLVSDTDMFAEGFYVPENVYILATMNDIDRSVESMDFAMRRRFTWQEVTPSDTESMLDTLSCAEEAKQRMNRLNAVIADTDGLGAAYMVGPSYFLKLADNGGDFGKLWRMNIEPLLKEYLRGFRKVNDIMQKFSKAYFTAESTVEDTDISDELE